MICVRGHRIEICFFNTQCRPTSRYFLFLPFDVDLHHDENVFLTILRTYIAMRMFFLAALRAHSLYSYVSETYD